MKEIKNTYSGDSEYFRKKRTLAQAIEFFYKSPKAKKVAVSWVDVNHNVKFIHIARETIESFLGYPIDDLEKIRKDPEFRHKKKWMELYSKIEEHENI